MASEKRQDVAETSTSTSGAEPSLTRFSSFQSSNASVYQDARFQSDSSQLDLRSDVNTSSASFASAATDVASTSSGATVAAARPEQSDSVRTSIDAAHVPEPSRPLSARSNDTEDGGHPNRLRDAASAAASRSSISQRSKSFELNRLSQHLSRNSTDNHGQTQSIRSFERQQEASFEPRDTRDQGSILPPAAFFAPKKPAARNSASNLLFPSQTNLTTDGRSTTPFSFTSVASQVNDEQENLTSPTRQGERRPSSPWGISASVHSSTNQLTSHNMDTRERSNSHPRLDSLKSDGDPNASSHHPSPKSVAQMIASTDPLIPSRRLNKDVASSQNPSGSHDKQLDPPATTTNASAETSEKRESRPSAKPSRKYRHFKGNNHFLFGGWLMSSGDNPLSFIASYAILLVLGGLFYGFEVAWLTRNISPAIVAFFTYIWLLAVVNMGVTAWKDPGVLPRDLDPNPPCVLGESGYEEGRQPLADPEDPLAIPVQRALRIRKQTVQVKWCETCGTYRPPRSSHCRVCDNCVENIDHHCTFLNTCIGRRNYLPFMVFLTTSILAALIVIACTVTRLVLLTKPVTFAYPRGNTSAPGLDFQGALQNSPVSAVLFLLCLGLLAPVTTLYVYHLRLILLNRSTVEQIRISTARDYGQHKELELTHAHEGSDAGSISNGVNQHGKRAGPFTALLQLVGLGKSKYKDPNPFATRKTTKNVRNGFGWRSIHLDSWIDRRGRDNPVQRLPHPRATNQATTPAHTHSNGLEWTP